MQRLQGLHLNGSKACVGSLSCRTLELLDVEFLLAGHRIGNNAVRHTVGTVTCCEHHLMHEFDMARRQISFAHCRQTAPPTRMLQACPADNGHSRENAVEVCRVALRHSEAFPPALRRADKVELLWPFAVSTVHKCYGHIADFLVGQMREIRESLVVRGELRRLFVRFRLVT